MANRRKRRHTMRASFKRIDRSIKRKPSGFRCCTLSFFRILSSAGRPDYAMVPGEDCARCVRRLRPSGCDYVLRPPFTADGILRCTPAADRSRITVSQTSSEGWCLERDSLRESVSGRGVPGTPFGIGLVCRGELPIPVINNPCPRGRLSCCPNIWSPGLPIRYSTRSPCRIYTTAYPTSRRVRNRAS